LEGLPGDSIEKKKTFNQSKYELRINLGTFDKEKRITNQSNATSVDVYLELACFSSNFQKNETMSWCLNRVTY